MSVGTTRRQALPRWAWPVLGLALAKSALSLGRPLASVPSEHPIPWIVFLALVVPFGATGTYLLLAGRRDPRAIQFGAFLVVAGTAFSDRLLADVGRTFGGLDPFDVLSWLALDALLPFFLWAFVAGFPRVESFERWTGIPATGQRISGIVGLLLVGASFALDVPGAVPPGSPFRGALEPLARDPDSLYWPIVLVLLVLALTFALWKTRRARPDERRRVRLFVAGLVGGLAPALLVNLLHFAWPAFSRFLSEPRNLRLVGAVAYPALLSIPVTTAYAVATRNALDVRLVVRRAVRYATARYSILVGLSIPFLALLGLLWQRRDQTIAELLSGPQALVPLGIGGAGIFLLLFRRPALDAVDRLFFREEYDARRILQNVVHRSGKARDLGELAILLTTEVDRALHLERIAFFQRSEDGTRLVAVEGDVRPLPLESPLGRLLRSERGVVELVWEDPGSPLYELPMDDREWAADGGYRALVPLRGSSGEPLGLLALGEKRSELPLTGEDRELLSTIAASAALRLDALLSDADDPTRAAARRGRAPSARAAAPTPALECAACGAVHSAAQRECLRCGGRLESASLPQVIGGKYRVLRRIGRGGMGVVYLADDLNLGRRVVVKTLPRVSPRHAQRLRREARAMATVSHPGVALIYAAESWRSTPLLIVEYLPGGTLEDRLGDGPLSPAEAVRLGHELVAAIAHVHDAGVLHRDIKPSNIGFASDRAPKLLDFGIARMLEVAAGPPGGEGAATLTGENEVVGTLPYMSPEAIAGERPRPSFDVWSLTVVLFEAMSGSHPFGRGPPRQVIARILSGPPADLGDALPGAPAPARRFFAEALSSSAGDRPRTARELERRIRRLAEELRGPPTVDSGVAASRPAS